MVAIPNRGYGSHMQQPLAHFDAADLKLVYRVLHKNLMNNIELMDSDFFEQLQTWLQSCAQADGVDTTDHQQWDAWLGNKVVACEDRMQDRKRLTLL